MALNISAVLLNDLHLSGEGTTAGAVLTNSLFVLGTRDCPIC